MATDLAKLVVRLEAQTALYDKRLEQATKQLNAFSRRQKTILGALDRQFSSFGKKIAASVAAYASIRTLRSVVEISDEYARLRGRLALVTENSAELADVQQKLFGVAQRTRTEYAGVADLYIKLAQTGKELNATQADLLKFTEGVGNALTVSGASAQTASGALLQLSQALAGGTVRAEEFNSINEGAPEILRTVAKNIEGMDGSIAKLRAAVLEGKVSSQDFFRAFLMGSDDLKSQAEGLPVTVGQAFTRLQNNVNQAIGSADMSPLVDSINELSQLVADPQFQKGMAAFISGAAKLVSTVLQVPASFGSFGEQIGYGVALLTGNVSKLDELEAGIRDVDRALKGGLDTPIKYTFTSDERLQEIRAELEKQRQAILDTYGVSTQKAIDETGNAAEEAAAKLLKLQETEAQREKARKAAEAAAKKAAEERQRATDTITDQVRALETEIATLGRGALATIEYEIAHGELAETFRTAGAGAEQYKQRLVDLTLQLEAQKAAQEKAEKAMEDYKDLMAEGKAVFEATRTPAEEYAAKIEKLNKLLEVGAINQDTYTRAVKDAQDALDKATEKGNEFLKRATENAQDIIADTLKDGFSEGADGILERFRKLLADLAAEAVAAQIGRYLFGANGIGGGGGLIDKGLNFLTSYFGGGRAGGGRVQAGMAYEVGENGREMFIPDSAGTVVPHGALAGGGMVVNNYFTVEAPRGTVGRQTQQQITAAAAKGIQRASDRNN